MSMDKETIASECPLCKTKIDIHITTYQGLIESATLKTPLSKEEREEKIKKLRAEVMEGIDALANLEIER